MMQNGRNLSPVALNLRRRTAVKLRLDGATLAEVARNTGLSSPTIIAAHKAYLAAGWEGVDVKPRGRPSGGGRLLSADQERKVLEGMRSGPPNASPLWGHEALRDLIRRECDVTLGERTVARYLEQWAMVPRDASGLLHEADDPAVRDWCRVDYADIVERARREKAVLLWAGGPSPSSHSA
jgi:sulfate adenylyltransferase subunit 2